MVERSLRMREAQGSIPWTSIIILTFCPCTTQMLLIKRCMQTLSLESLAEFLPSLKKNLPSKSFIRHRISSNNSGDQRYSPRPAGEDRRGRFMMRRPTEPREELTPERRRLFKPAPYMQRNQPLRSSTMIKKKREVMDEGTIRTVKVENSQVVERTFADLIDADLAKSLFEQKRIEKPTSIQLALLEHFSKSKMDIMLKAETGTGKTLGYVIAILNYLRTRGAESGKVEVLVLTPSVLLGEQVVSWLRELSPEVSVGNSIEEHPTILVSSGRNDRLRMSLSSGKSIQPSLVVVDETDALLKPLKRYATARQKECRMQHPNTTLYLLKDLRCMNPTLRLLYTSATLNQMTRSDLRNSRLLPRGAIFLDASNGSEIAFCPRSITHHHVFIPEADFEHSFYSHLTTVLEKERGRGILFLPPTYSKSEMMRSLEERGIKCDYLNQPTPTSVATTTNNKQRHLDGARLLVGSHTDARGLDIPSVQFVVSWSVPDTPNTYLHCAGRVGRMGRPGNVYNLLGPDPVDLHRYTSVYQYLRFQSKLLSPSAIEEEPQRVKEEPQRVT